MRNIVSRLFRGISIWSGTSEAEIVATVLSVCGVAGSLLGMTVVLPSLELSPAGLYLAILLVIAFPLLCYATALLTIIADELRKIRKSS